MNKVTKHVLAYPEGNKPDYIIPNDYSKYRYALGKKGKNPLVVICMNPSAAKEDYSDMTINRIIKVSSMLNYDGWIVFNLYPERATNAKNLEKYNEKVSEDNKEIIRKFLVEHSISEVWGAWGNINGIETLKLAKRDVLNMLTDLNVRVYYFGTLGKEGNPRHPLQRSEKVIFDNNCKNYL
ncbi:hypothetical protein SAMN02910289_01254 [Lachnospiraceae bacterium RM5]|nr:hypothetical protein SAMN02910289_01254 [Lachnospiraceae bacterium RM5]